MKQLPVNLRASEQAKEFIKKFEQMWAKMYYCPAGKPTIGYGHVILPAEQHLLKATISLVQANELLNADVAIAEVRLRRLWKVAMTQNMYDMLVSLVFNVGAPKPHQGIVTKINGGDSVASIKASLLAWNKIRDKKNELVVSNGLSRRRREEAAIMFS